MATVTTPLRIGLADHGRRMTLDEFEEAGFEEGYRYELARGVLEVSEVPGEPHALIVWVILRLIAGYDREHPRIIHRAGGGGGVSFPAPRHEVRTASRRRGDAQEHPSRLAWISHGLDGLRGRLGGERSP